MTTSTRLALRRFRHRKAERRARPTHDLDYRVCILDPRFGGVSDVHNIVFCSCGWSMMFRNLRAAVAAGQGHLRNLAITPDEVQADAERRREERRGLDL